MSSDFIARPLLANQVMQAYPLVQALDPQLSPESWCEFAASALEFPDDGGTPHSRIMTLQTAGGYIHALFIYRINRDLRDGRRLEVDHLVAFELPGQVTAVTAALRVIEQIARDSGCEAIAVATPMRNDAGKASASMVSDTLHRSGYDIGPGMWRKKLRNSAGDEGKQAIPREPGEPPGQG